MKKNIKLALTFAKNDFKQRYLGTGLGQIWYLISPILMIFIYTVIFADFMKMKMNFIENDNSYAYSVYLIPAILAWTTFNTMIGRLSNCFEQKSSLIKKINVPMYTFQLSILITETLLLILSFFLAVFYLIIIEYHIGFNFLWLIPLIFFQTLFSFGLGVIISLFVPFIKDIKFAIPVIMQLWFWITPIIYFKEMIIDKFPYIIKFNPLFYFIESYHNIFVYNIAPKISHIIIIFIMSLFIVSLSVYLYKKMINEIKDII